MKALKVIAVSGTLAALSFAAHGLRRQEGRPGHPRGRQDIRKDVRDLQQDRRDLRQDRRQLYRDRKAGDKDAVKKGRPGHREPGKTSGRT